MAGRAERKATDHIESAADAHAAGADSAKLLGSDKQTELVFCDDMGCHIFIGFGRDR